MNKNKRHLYEGFSHRFSPYRILCMFIDYVDDSFVGLFIFNIREMYKEYRERNLSFQEQLSILENKRK